MYTCINQFLISRPCSRIFSTDFKCIFFFQAVLFLLSSSAVWQREGLLSADTTSSSLTSFLPEYNSSELHTAGSLYDHMITDLHFVVFRIKKTNLPTFLESLYQQFLSFWSLDRQEQKFKCKFKINRLHEALLLCFFQCFQNLFQVLRNAGSPVPLYN